MLNFLRKIAFGFTMIILIFAFKLFPSKAVQIRRYFAKLNMICMGSSVELLGEFDKNANMIILNHQSMLDIIALECIYPGNLAWIAKIEIEKMPFFGTLIKAGNMISIDRDNPRDIVRVVKEAKDRLENGRILAIFPEGTRGNGKQLLEFKPGVKLIAKKLDLKIQPILIKNSNEILDKSLNINPAKLIIKALPLVDLSDENWLLHTKELMQKELDVLNS